jgi:hypothetical protein
MEFAIAGRLTGPLDYIMVSMHWGRLLFDSPSLWTRIYVQNGEDEMARISTFLYLSKQSPLHIDIMTVLPTVDNLRLVAEHISRVRTISIRPGAPDTVTGLLHTKQWELAASCILATLLNGMQLCDLESSSCFGVHLWNDARSYFHVILMQFIVATRVASSHELNHTWEGHIGRWASIPQYYNPRGY